MYFLIYSDDIEGLKAELEKEPELLFGTHQSETWLNLAAHYGRVDMIHLLTDMGLEADGDNGKISVLTSALRGEAKSMEAFELLLTLGAKVDGVRSRDYPIATAISYDNFEAFTILLDRGARTDIHWGHFNYNPMTYAQSFGEERQRFVDELVRRGVPVELPQEPQENVQEASVSNSEDAKDFYTILKQYYGEFEGRQITRIVAKSNIAVRHIKAYDQSCQILVSDGMRHAIRSGIPSEIMLLWPFTDKLSPDSIKDSTAAWPFNFLLNLAENLVEIEGLVHGDFFTIDLGEPITEGSKLSVLLVLRERTHFEESGVTGNLYKIIPIHAEEFAFYQEHGAQALFQVFEKNDVPMTIDLARKSVV
ncbi:hypothetical protein A3715_37675 [Oleiphilus sp. HI0009]